ncbi:dihydrolipoyllysine-residue acetyltransferase [Taylorella equigenitalis]|uniref:dihydrolipoyllysine-residue acetyltransferase n=1 Tax=Taylorella equigenitalis TaxID=29575 RepID=UPI0004298D54|nr:dihydrolipoyllysine-residue acetyltransferase [Taylorella equigenitalis]WDU54061.1 dihydrolipoyllysine-residue acetyltransferase [Taylorella equigenitalis]
MSQLIEVKVPDIGDFDDVSVIEVLVKEGDKISVDQSIITVESDKASMEIPSSASGIIKKLSVKLGDKVKEGVVLLTVESTDGDSKGQSSEISQIDDSKAADNSVNEKNVSKEQGAGGDSGIYDIKASQLTQEKQNTVEDNASSMTFVAQSSDAGDKVGKSKESPTAAYALTANEIRNLPHASPSVRQFARSLGVDLNQVKGTGRKNRIVLDDVRSFVKSALSAPGGVTTGSSTLGGSGLSVLDWPKVDFSKFGEIDSKPLSRIKKISGANLHRNWVMIPHVTNNDEADITDLEAFRVQLNKEHEKSGIKFTMLAFIFKAVVQALKKYPEFNSSIDGENIVYKKYFHLGFAADTPNGLVVPVIRDADKKSISDIAKETSELAKLARDGKLSPSQMQGGCFTISSLGGIGGTHFTPIINAPEVAILGVSRSYQKPVWNGKEFQPRLTLPLSLSYDHRIIDGAAAARFNVCLCQILSDFRRAMI